MDVSEENIWAGGVLHGAALEQRCTAGAWEVWWELYSPILALRF